MFGEAKARRPEYLQEMTRVPPLLHRRANCYGRHMLRGLAGKAALIAGGASGIGAATASAVGGDIADVADVAKMVGHALDVFGQLDILHKRRPPRRRMRRNERRGTMIDLYTWTTPNGLAHVARWLEAVGARPAVQRGMAVRAVS
jgi:hypothetical protein